MYWNSRLQGEHDRIIGAIDETAVVCTFGKGSRLQKTGSPVSSLTEKVWCSAGDMFAGVGPFSIPLAKKGCKVYANDLNGRSYHYLCENARTNKVGHGRSTTYPSSWRYQR